MIKLVSCDIIYIFQDILEMNPIFNEASLTQYKEAFKIDAQIVNTGGFGGDGDLMTKFGLDIHDTVDFIISAEQFNTITGLDRPRELDLIYFQVSPASNIFQIKFVEDEEIFYQLGKNYIFNLKCELYQYTGGDIIDTGNERLDGLGEELLDMSTYTAIVSLDKEPICGDGIWDAEEELYQKDEEFGIIFKGLVVGFDEVNKKVKLTEEIGELNIDLLLTGTETSYKIVDIQRIENKDYGDNKLFQDSKYVKDDRRDAYRGNKKKK